MTFRYFKNATPYFLIAAIAFYMFRGIFAPGLMSGCDNSFHYYDAHYLTNVLIPKYHWIGGWSMQQMAGIPILMDYYQTGFLAIAILNKLFCIPLNLSYKFMVLLSYASLGVGFYKLSSYRFGKISSLIITICLMLQKDIYADKILGGMWNNYLAIAIFLIFFHMLDKNIDRLTPKRAAALSLLLGLIILTHIFVAIFSFLVLFIYTVFYLRAAIKRRMFFKSAFLLALVPALAFLVSSYYLYGFVSARNYFAAYSSKDIHTGIIWSLKSFFGPLEHNIKGASGLLLNIPVMLRIILSLFGIYVFLGHEDDRKIKRFMICSLVFIILSTILFSDLLPNLFSWWKNVPFASAVQSNRFVIYIQIGLYIFAAYGIYKFFAHLKNKRLATLALLTILAVSTFFHYDLFAKDASRTIDQSPQMDYMRKVWDWVNKNITPDDCRIAYQNTYGNIDDPILARSDAFALSGVFTNVAEVGVARSATPFPQERYTRIDHGCIFGKRIGAVDVSYIKKMMDYLNAKYIVAVEPILKTKLEETDLFFKEVAFGPFSVFRLVRFDGGWVKFNKTAKCEAIKIDDQYARFNIVNEYDDNIVYPRIAYHPFWKAYLDGRGVNITPDEYGLMKIRLAKRGDLRLELFFKPVNYFIATISILSFVLTIAIMIFQDDKRETT